MEEMFAGMSATSESRLNMVCEVMTSCSLELSIVR